MFPRLNAKAAVSVLRRNWRVGMVAVSVLVFIGGLGAVFYLRGESMMRMQLSARLQSIATVASLQFSAEEIAQIMTPEDMEKPVYRDVVRRLYAIRQAIPDVQYAYIVRATPNPATNTVAFVADADGYSTFIELDRNGNGVLEPEEESSYPGDLYDVRDVPALQGPAFTGPVVDSEITYDQWGAFISGYAPIRDAAGRSVAVVGIDMRAEEFLLFSQAIFSPLAFLLVLVAGTLIALYMFWAVASRRMAAMRQVEDERSGLLQLTLHRIGTPLTIFKWSVEMLGECVRGAHCTRESLQEHLEQIAEGVQRMEAIIDALLRADRIDASASSIAVESLDIAAVLEDMRAETSPAVRREQKTLLIEVPSDIRVQADRALLMGVLHELIENARIYSPAGTTIRVRVRAHRSSVTIDVRDEGCGIPSQDISRMFNRFVRGKNATRFNPDGDGLGLFIARRLLERIGGRIWLESAGEGKGTTAHVSLPLAPKEHRRASSAHRA